MSGFSADWLALREPFDLAARNAPVRDAVARHVAGRETLVLTDLGSGTGSTMGALAPSLGTRQHWHLCDHDAALLAIAATRASDRVAIDGHHCDLAENIADALAPIPDIVTTSALLDLVSRAWLDRLVAATVRHHLPVYAALSYNGEISFGTPHPHDAAIIAGVNAHQRTDKGFGPALGPHAAATAIASWQHQGYAIVQGASDWVMGAADQAIQHELLAGWAGAAQEMQMCEAGDIDGWLADRSTSVRDGLSTMRVGHTDFFAIPSVQR